MKKNYIRPLSTVSVVNMVADFHLESTGSHAAGPNGIQVPTCSGG